MLVRDVSTVWGVFARGLAVGVIEPDGADRVLVDFGGSMRASVPVGGVALEEVN